MWLSFKSPIKNMKIGFFTLRLEHIKLWLFSRSCPILHFACEILPQLITNWPVTTYQAFLFYRAGVYWIYILWIHPSCLKSNFQCTPALEKRMTIHCLASGWIGKYDPLGNLHPSALEIASGGVFSNTPLPSAVYYYIIWKDTSRHWIKLELPICIKLMQYRTCLIVM